MKQAKGSIRLKTAIVGAGLMGRWHAAAIARIGHRLTAVIDWDLKRAAHLASTSTGSCVYQTLEEALERECIDVVHICTPTTTHSKLAALAVSQRIHLLIEKPVAATGVETERLLERAEKAGGLLCPVHQFLFQDGVQSALKNMGRIGRIVHVDATFCSAGAQQLGEERWDAVAADILPHPLSLLQRILPEGTSPLQWFVTRSSPGEWRVHGSSEGVSASILISLSARPTRAAISIFGSRASFTLDLFHGFSVFEHGRVSRFGKISQPFLSGSRNLTSAAINLTRRVLVNEFAYPGLNRLVKEFYAAASSEGIAPITPVETLIVARVRDLLISQTPAPLFKLDLLDTRT